ncbi:hypothetical protein HDV00_011490 [Rhizophlyctis rosea]|nr:hypothetical protein HDV00_011490 [Rhizophlyctis rosea]
MPGASSYDDRKTYDGKQYTGMKVAPDRWRIDYNVLKRRKGHAPEGSGAPVGTEYHWFIVAHQLVRKTDANTYTTHMEGWKYKLAHKRAEADEFNLKTEEARRNREVAILEDAWERVQDMAAQDRLLAGSRGGSAGKKRKVEKGQRTLEDMFVGAKKKAKTGEGKGEGEAGGAASEDCSSVDEITDLDEEGDGWDDDE